MSYKILVVDDEPSLVEILKDDLEFEGFEIETALNGEQAIQKLKHFAADLVISDMIMPNGDGLYVLRTIKEKSITDPSVLFITGESKVSIEDAYDQGCETIMAKPVDIKKLISTIRQIQKPLDQRWDDESVNKSAEQALAFATTSSKSPGARQSIKLGRRGFFAQGILTAPKVGEKIRFELFDDHLTEAVCGIGEIRWIRSNSSSNLPSGFGVAFSYIQPNSRKNLAKLVDQLSSKAAIPKF